jgi:hypothetical protein
VDLAHEDERLVGTVTNLTTVDDSMSGKVKAGMFGSFNLSGTRE